MFKRSTKITSLLVVAASVASMTPVYAADYKKIDSEDGTVYNAVAYKDGQFYIDGEINDEDEATYYYKDGKYNELDDIDSGDDVQPYGNKYVEVGSKNDGDYYLDLTTGKVTDDEIAQDTLDDASSAVKRKVKKDDPSRYSEPDKYPYAVAADGTISSDTIDDTDTMGIAKISSNKFADDWYEVKYDADQDENINNNAKQFSVYTDNEGNYIDADYNLGKVSVITTTHGSVDVKNTSDDKNDVRVAVEGIRTIGQDKNYIYRLAKVVGYGEGFVAFGKSDDRTAQSTTTAGATANEGVLVIQKISKAQDSDEVDGAKYAKTVYTYFVTDDDGDSEVDKLGDYFTVNNGKVITYRVDGDSIQAYEIDLKAKNGYNYTDFSDGDDHDLEDGIDSVDYDVDGNLYIVEGGYVYKFNNDDDFEKIYKVDGSFDRLSVYDKDNMVLWSSDDDDEVYSVIGTKTTSDDNTDDDANNGGTTVQVGWVQNTTDGSWSYYKEDGTKVVNNWVQSPTSGLWYFMNENGVMMANGWLPYGGYWYYLSESGAMKTGWIQLSGTWYYLDPVSGGPLGGMKTGWFQDTTGTWYYANESGAMLHDTTVGGYILGSNGAWVR